MDLILILNILFVVVIIMLILTWSKRSAVWGGATIGLVIGIIAGIFTGDIFFGGKTGLTIGGLLGFGSEVFGAIGKRQHHE